MRFLILSLAIFLAACTGQPAEGDIQTAISQTAEAEPTNTPEPTDTPLPSPTNTVVPTETLEPTVTAEPTETPTPKPSSTPSPVPLSAIDLEPLLILSGDLPGNLSPGQISDELLTQNVILGAVPIPDNFLNQNFYDEEEEGLGGTVMVYLYESVGRMGQAYDKAVSLMDGDYTYPIDTDGIGERSYGVWKLPPYHLAFTRCHAFVYIWMIRNSESDIIAYAQRLDRRLQEVVCQS